MLCVFAAPALASGIVPDGSTATTAAVGAGGRIAVGVAAAVGGVSTNNYREFNVPAAGVDLNNATARARTILNQVTGTRPSLLEGPLNVLGPRANVVIANPNGISVNGMVVQNIGNLALTTGQVTFNDVSVNGQLQRNLVLSTRQGAIDIGPGGLSGTLLNLELIAKQLRVAGKVENRYTDPNSRVRAVVGDSHAEIDASVSPGDNLSPWISYAAGGASSGNLALDITSAGSLLGGRVEVIVTDQGAGVRHAGAAYATAGDFLISGSGDLQLGAGKVGATRDVWIDSGGLFGSGSMTAGRHVQVTSERVALADSAIAAGTSTTGDIVIGAPGQTRSRTLALADTALDASGGIGLFDAGAGIALAGVRLNANGNLVIEGQGVRGLSVSAGRGRSALTSRQGVLSVLATDLLASGADIDGVGGVSIRTGDLTLRDATLSSTGGAVEVQAGGLWQQQDADVLAASNVKIQAGAMQLASATRQSTVIARHGGVRVSIDGDLVNDGALVQGQTRSDQAGSEGALAVRAGGAILNSSTPQYLGIFFGAADDVVVRAGGDIVNRHARMLSNARLDVAATGDLINEITRQPGANGDRAVVDATSGRRWLVLSKRSSTYDIDYGAVDRPGQTAYLLSDTGTTLSGRNVINTGGEIYANNGAISIHAADTFRTQGVPTGQAHYARTCMIVCRTSAASNTAVTGGLLSAGGGIDITAGRAAENIGGRVLALGDLTVDAPVTYASGLTGYTAIARDRGFKAFFGDTWARLYAMDVGGSWMATGRTRIGGDAVVNGGSFDGDVAIAGATTVSRPRQQDPVSVESHLGLTTWLWR
ncbi:filamentous hemagglutinin N-terminal domain-containing protein [Cupriavidus pauculus]|uniref:Filamentous hemagglutinin N-terminal domain-containing protein n=1 Tax=Cupriavidus pauculus TaxID=82633 RepID=A0A3G8H5S8_9BURK|nr:filamentous hemagglutinin N-terminal domain-containing protein [Cupriavidus pauculus]AZG14892.1 filamentous hemagglutinin N-terminal domain-containing protein [Cupriavidus pauculus]